MHLFRTEPSVVKLLHKYADLVFARPVYINPLASDPTAHSAYWTDCEAPCKLRFASSKPADLDWVYPVHQVLSGLHIRANE